MGSLEATKRVLIKYARNTDFNWERIANEIRAKGLDYDYYETFFTFYRNGVPIGYDWINGNDKWKKLLRLIREGMQTKELLKAM